MQKQSAIKRQIPWISVSVKLSSTGHGRVMVALKTRAHDLLGVESTWRHSTNGLLWKIDLQETQPFLFVIKCGFPVYIFCRKP